MNNDAGRGRIEVITGPMFAGKTEELMRRVRRATIAGLRVLVVNHALDDRRGASLVSSHAGGAIPATSVSGAAELHAVVDEPGRTGRTDAGPSSADAESSGPVASTVRSLDLLAIDEAQFFGADLVPVVVDLADRGVTVVVSGLCLTFDDQPFEPLPALMATAESVTKLLAVCAVCGADAAFHRRVHGHSETGMPGADVRVPGVDTSAPGSETAVPVAGEGAGAGVGNSLVATVEHVGGAEQYQARCRRHR
ncbi:thymidine kinase [Citricoccus nitrophenolicus]|uniref:Thymidine kinase n=1 Tax=Citricoccus muralis TaxID=169134 RepID=A0A3D9LBR9_9MICC|nr:thymidine kinase [Citricoccus muralis]REE03602.1 thymidine kinase [Citricoccus muralis]